MKLYVIEAKEKEKFLGNYEFFVHEISAYKIQSHPFGSCFLTTDFGELFINKLNSIYLQAGNSMNFELYYLDKDRSNINKQIERIKKYL